MMRELIVAALLAAELAGTPAMAAVAAGSTPDKADSGKCEDNEAKKAKRSMFGNILGSIGGTVLGQVGGSAGQIASLAMPAASYLGSELLKLLDCKEQKQAAAATEQAMRGGVGTEISWKSESRANVSGKSKVTAQNQLADGSTCLTVSDVVIVDGEETTVPKRMCRSPGASGYARA